MNKNRLLKLTSLILLTAAVLSGALQGGPAPALALDCPDSYPSGSRICYRVSVVCDGGECCCEYAPDQGFDACKTYCY